MIIQLPTWQTVRRSPQVRQLLQILQLLLQHILAFLQKLKVPQYAGAAMDYVTPHIRNLGTTLYNEIPPLPEFPPEYRELLLLPQKLAELPQHIPDYMYPSFWKAVYDDLPPLPVYMYPSWWRELYDGLPGWLFPSYYRNLALDAILKIWSVYIGFLASRDTSRDIEDSPQELYDTLSQTRDAVVELLQEDALPPKQVSQAPQTEVLMEEEEEEPEQQPADEEAGVWSVESANGGKGQGLSRYAGVESLVELEDGAAPIVPPVQTISRHSMVLSSIPDTTEEPRVALPPLDEPEKPDISTTEDEFEDVSESSSKDKEGIWASLVSKYAEPDKLKKEKSRELDEEDLDDGPEYVGTADEIVKRYTAKSAVSLDLDEDEDDGRPMTDDDFTKVGLRLEEYLSRLDEDEDVPSVASKVKVDKVKKSKVKVAKESKMVSSKKEKPQEKVESMEEELITGDDTEREPTMEDIEAELRRLEEMEAEIALMEQKEKEALAAGATESTIVSESAGKSMAEKLGNKLATGNIVENLQHEMSQTMLNLSDKLSGSGLSEEIIKSEKIAKILESEELLEKFEAEIPKDVIESEISKESIQSEQHKESLEIELSDSKLTSENLEEMADSGRLEEIIESQPSEDKLDNEIPKVTELEKSDIKYDFEPSEDKLASQQEKLESKKSDDKLESEASVDKIESEASVDKVISEASEDRLESQASEDMLESQASEDVIKSQASEDNLKSLTSDDMLESQTSEDKLRSQASDDMLESQLSEDKLESELSEGMIESEKSDEKIESEGSVEYSETTESESEPITQLPGEKITIELSASVTDSGSIRGFFTNLWNRADNQQMVEKSFEKTLTSESKQAAKIEEVDTVIETEEIESKEPESDSSEKSADPASIKDFFQSLWTRADNHVNLEKVKENVALQNEEVDIVKEIITEENLLNDKESKTLLETNLDVLETNLDETYEEEPAVSVEVIVKPEDKPVPKSILKKPSVDLSMPPQEKTFEMKVEELKAEMGEKSSKTPSVSAEEKTFDTKVKELKADMMDKATFKKPFMEELEQEKTFEMKIEALKSQMEEVEIEVKGKEDEPILIESESKYDASSVSPAQQELIDTKLDEKVPENICEEESKDKIKPSQSEPKQSNVETLDELSYTKTSVSIDTEHDKETITAVSESDNTSVSVIEVVESTVIQPDIGKSNLVTEKEESDIKAEIHAAMEETDESEVKVDIVNKDSPISDKQQKKIEDELKQVTKEADASNSSSKRPPVAAWRGTWSQATLDDIGDFETEAVIDDSMRDLSKRKGSTISDSGSVKGFFENLWKCAEVEGIKTKSSLDSKSRSESMDAGSLLESSNDKKDAEATMDTAEKQTEISQNEDVPEVAYLGSQETTPEEVTAAAVMTEFWGRRIEESDDEDILIKQNALVKEAIPEADFWNRKIMEDSSVEKETSAPIDTFWGTTNKASNEVNEELVTETSYSASETEKLKVSEENTELEGGLTNKEENKLQPDVSTDESTPISDFWNRKILEDSSVEKETPAPLEGFWGAVDKISKGGEEVLTSVTDFWGSESKELKTSQEPSEIPTGTTKDEEVLTSVTDFWGSESKELKTPQEPSEIEIGTAKDTDMELEQKEPTKEITPVTNFWDLKQQEDSSVEKDDSAPADGFWYSIHKPSNESEEVLSTTADFWGSKAEKSKTAEVLSDIQTGLTKGEEMELKDYLEQKDGCETDTGSMDIGSMKELDKTIGKYSPMTVSSLEKEDSIPKHLEDVEDLLVPSRPARGNKKSSPVNVDDDVDMPEADPYMRKYMEMPANLTEDEEMELRDYMEQHKDESEELSLERYLEMNPDLTEEEKADYEDLLIERQAMRDREHKDLAKYLDMPVGLTEEEREELEMLEKEEGDEGEEWNEAANFRELLDMPADLTEEELRILQEDQGDEEMEFEDEDAYRQYIRQKFLMQLDEEAYAAYDDDEGGYGYETEYEGDAEYDDEYEEEMEGEYVMVHEDEDVADSEQQKDSMVDGSANTDSVLMKTKRIFGFKKSSNENSVEGSPGSGKKFKVKKGSSEEKSKEESPGASKKKVGFFKSATKDTSEEGSPAPSKKKFGFPKLVTKESNESGSPATQKKFFRFGSLGTKKKKGTSNESLEKTESGNSFIVGVCTIERDLHMMTECFTDLNYIDNLKKDSFTNLMEVKNKDIIANIPNAELCKSLSESLSNLISKENSKSIQNIDSSLLSTSRIKHECEVPEVFLYSPPAGDTKDQREVISPGEEDLDFWHQWQSEEKATARLSNEWVDDLDVIEEESELGEGLDVIYEESEDEFNFEDIARRNSDSECQQMKKEVSQSNNDSKPEDLKYNIENVGSENESETRDNNHLFEQSKTEEIPFSANHVVKKMFKPESNLLTANEPLLKDQYKVKSIKRENSEEEINKGLERISEEIYELTEEKEDFDWWGHINCSEDPTSNFGGLMKRSVKNMSEHTQISNDISEMKVNELRESVCKEILTDERLIDCTIDTDILSEHGTETYDTQTNSKSNTNNKITEPMNNIYDRFIEPGFEDDHFIEPLESIKQINISVIPRIEITEAEENNVYELSYLGNTVNYEYDKVGEPLSVHENSTYQTSVAHEEEYVNGNDSTDRTISDPFYFHKYCEKSTSIEHEEELKNKNDIRKEVDNASDGESESEGSEAIGYLILEEERDSMGFEVDVNIEVEQTATIIKDNEHISQCSDNKQIEENPVKCMKNNHIEEESTLAAIHNTSKEEKGLECLANSSVLENSVILEEEINSGEDVSSAFTINKVEEIDYINCMDNDLTRESSVLCITQNNSEKEIISVVMNNTSEGRKSLNCLDDKQQEESSVICVERKKTEEDITSDVKTNIVEEIEILNYLDNKLREESSVICKEKKDAMEESTSAIVNKASAKTCTFSDETQIVGEKELSKDMENVHLEETYAMGLKISDSEQVENNTFCLDDKQINANSALCLKIKNLKEESTSSSENIIDGEEVLKYLDNCVEVKAKSVICIERNDSELESIPDLKNRTAEEEEDILQCLDNEIDTLVTKIKTVHRVNIETNELVLSKNIVNNCLISVSCGESVTSSEGNCSTEDDTSPSHGEIVASSNGVGTSDSRVGSVASSEGNSISDISTSESRGVSVTSSEDSSISEIGTSESRGVSVASSEDSSISEIGTSESRGGKSVATSDVGTVKDLGSVVECVEVLSFTSPRTNSSSNSNSSSQHILSQGDKLPEASVSCGAAMADVDDSVETRMEVDEGVEDAEEVEVQDDAAAGKEEEDEDVMGKYVDKQDKMDDKPEKMEEEGFNFNKDDDDDDDELPDFEAKPKKKSSKSSKENGVDDDGKKKKKRRKAPDGKKLRPRKTGEEKENSSSRKATYQNDDILAKHVGPRVRSFDTNKIQKKFDKPKELDRERNILREGRTSDDILAKHVGPRVRSYDSNKMKKKFNRPKPASTQLSNDCKMCGKQVYQMEKIVAEKASWHKNCFRCIECNKNLTLETYQSHEGKLYCKPHFKELFQPKAVVEDESVARQERLKRRPRMIVLENNPDEQAEGVVRATDKPDYGLEELSSANVKQKFSMFENKAKEKDTRNLEPANVRRSQSLMNKAARFLKGDEEDSEGEYGVKNSYLGEYDEEDDEDEDEEEEEEEESEYEEVEVTDEEAEEEEEIKVNGTKENGQHDEEDEDEEKDDEEKDDEERDDEEKDEEENEDKDEIKENGIDEEVSKPKKKATKIIKVKKEKPKKEKKEKRSRRERPMSIAGAQAGELKSQWENKNRRDRMREMRSKELSKFRQMLCAGKNTNLKEMFESGKIDNADSDDERTSRKEQIKIERAQAASRIKDRFEKGDVFDRADSDEDKNYTDERRECEEIFREAETARAARNRFRQIDSKVKGEGRDIMRSQSFANAPITNRRLSNDGGHVDTEIVRASDRHEDFEVDSKDLASRFKFFTNYEATEQQKVEDKRRSRSFRFTPPKDGVVMVDEEKEFMARMPKACMAINCPVCRSRGLEPATLEDYSRDPNLIKSTDKVDDNIDCARTKTLLNMFKKMEMQGSDDDEQGPPPPRRFTPPPEGEEYDSEEYSDEEYTDDEDDYTDDDEEDEDEEDENGVRVPKYKDEVLEMLSARKAANLRAKFEKWENGRNDMNRGSDEEGEEAMPSIDTARNLRKMFENKATEQPVLVNKPKHKVNRFV